MGPDGKIWAGFSRIDPKTMMVDGQYTWMDSPNLPPGPHGLYVDLTSSTPRATRGRRTSAAPASSASMP